MSIPQALKEAIAEHHRLFPPQPRRRPNSIDPGDIVVIKGGGKSRVVHINRHGLPGQVLIHLCHSYPEMATDFDLIFEGGEVTPFPLVVQADLYGTVWMSQVATRLGQIPIEQSQAIRRSLLSDAESVEHLHVGMPLGGIFDPRREFKVSELHELQYLTTSALRAGLAYLDGEALWFDPSRRTV